MNREEGLKVVVIVELAVIIILASMILVKIGNVCKLRTNEVKQEERVVEETERVEETTKREIETKKQEETVKETKKAKKEVKETETTEQEEKEETTKIDIEKESNMITTNSGKKWVKVDEYTFFEIGRNEKYIKVSMYEILKEFGTKGKVAGKNGYMYDGKFWYEVAPSEFAEMK